MAVRISTFPRRDLRRRKLPLTPALRSLRIAQVTLPGLLFENTQYFAPVRGSGLQEFSPHMLVGSAAHLSALAVAVQENQIDLPELQYALFVITDFRDVPIQDSTRVMLWQVFGVPVYEVLLGADDLPIATECDAHEGWHIEDGVTFFANGGQLWFKVRRGAPLGTGLTGSIEDAPCACGRPGKRIVNAQLDFRDPIRARFAAIA